MNRYELKRRGGKRLLQESATGVVLGWRHAKKRLLPEALEHLKDRAAVLEVMRLDGQVEITYTFSDVPGEEPHLQLHWCDGKSLTKEKASHP